MDSKLQLISGAFKGRKLNLPRDARPTQNRARIALFNMLDGIMDGTPALVWDAFAGSGAFGIECLSRYVAANVIFTDTNPSSVSTVRANLNLLNVGARGRVMQADAIGAISQHGAMADLVFVDPPYSDADVGVAFVRRLAQVARPGAIVIWEQDSPNAVTPDENMWELLRDKRYGRARFLVLRKK